MTQAGPVRSLRSELEALLSKRTKAPRQWARRLRELAANSEPVGVVSATGASQIVMLML